MSEVSYIERIDAPREDGSITDALAPETPAEVSPIAEAPAALIAEQTVASEVAKATALLQYGRAITDIRNKEVLNRAA